MITRSAFIGCLASAAAFAALSGCASTDSKEPSALKVLMIGNSYSISCLAHLPQVAVDRGEDLDLASLYIGGCNLKRHWENAQKDGKEGFAPYRFDRVVCGKRTVDGAKRNVCEVLRMAKWDIVTVQQSSHDSWKPETYQPYGDKLIAKIRELAPQAKILVQETWSYTPWDKRMKNWGLDQNSMYRKAHKAYSDFAGKYGLSLIPMGTAVQEWRRRLPVKYTENSFGGDVVGGGKQEERDHFKRNADGKWVPNCDVFHLGRKGEYLQALVWAKALFPDIDLMELEYCPSYVSESDARLMKQIAMGLK